jgi:CRISPR-associated protein Csm2
MGNFDLKAKPEMLSEEAFGEAMGLVLSELSSSQFRNYFGELRDIERQFDAGRLDWSSVRLRLHLLKARLAYGRRKNGGRVSEKFYQLLNYLLNEAQTNNDSFKQVLLYIEAILAYFYPLEELYQSIRKDNKIREEDKNRVFMQRAQEEYMRGAK